MERDDLPIGDTALRIPDGLDEAVSEAKARGIIDQIESTDSNVEPECSWSKRDDETQQEFEDRAQIGLRKLYLWREMRDQVS